MKIKLLKNDDRNLSIQLAPTGEWLLVALGALLMLLAPIIIYLLGWVVTIDMRDGVFAHQQAMLQLFGTENKTLRYDEIQHFKTEIRKSAIATSMVAVIQKTNGRAEDLRLGDMSGDESIAVALHRWAWRFQVWGHPDWYFCPRIARMAAN
jgi:hypothetical protein